MEDVCRDFMNHRCNKRHCNYIHDKNLCKDFYKSGNCRWEPNCKKNHFVTDTRHLRKDDEYSSGKHVKNTETFEPNYNPPSMRILVEYGKKKCEAKLQTQDVLLVPDFFANSGDVYEKLVDEVLKCGDVLVPWHGDSHLIANDKLNFKEKCPTYLKVIEKIKNYFNMRIEATRFNFYSTDDEWKPYHFDSAGVRPEKAKTQNFTVAVSFGKNRLAGFEEVEGKKVTAFPCPDGSCYCFTRDLNTTYRHGILPVLPEKRTGEGRVSVIAWGWVDQDEVR